MSKRAALPNCVAGSIYEEQKRAWVPWLLSTHIVVSLSVIGLNVWGTIAVYNAPPSCVSEVRLL
jgi:hypothetical protein